jgi:uncharacterized membrane protein YbaN (DUF454 family)
MNSTFVVLPSMTLGLALSMTFNKWVYYTLYIHEMAQRFKSKVKLEKISKKNFYNNCATVVLVVFLTTFTVVVTSIGCDNKKFNSKSDNELWMTFDERSTMGVSVIYAVFTVAFLTVGFVFIWQMRKEHDEFYKQYRCKLIAGVLCLTLPLMLRCVLDFVNSNEKFHDWLIQNPKRVATYNLLFFLLTDYSIILSQTLSFLFGVLRENLERESSKLTTESPLETTLNPNN